MHRCSRSYECTKRAQEEDECERRMSLPELRPSCPTRTAVSSPRDFGNTTCTSKASPRKEGLHDTPHAPTPTIAETMAVCTQHCLSEWMGGQVSDNAAASSVEPSRTHANTRTSNERLVEGMKSAAPSNVMTSDWHWSPYLRSRRTGLPPVQPDCIGVHGGPTTLWR